MFERLQEKFSLQIKNNIRSTKLKTGTNFYKRNTKKSSIVRKGTSIDKSINKQIEEKTKNTTQTIINVKKPNHVSIPIKGFQKIINIQDSFTEKFNGINSTNTYKDKDNCDHNKSMEHCKEDDIDRIEPSNLKFRNTDARKLFFHIKDPDSYCKKSKEISLEENKHTNDNLNNDIVKNNQQEINVDTFDSSRRPLKPKNNYKFLGISNAYNDENKNWIAQNSEKQEQLMQNHPGLYNKKLIKNRVDNDHANLSSVKIRETASANNILKNNKDQTKTLLRDLCTDKENNLNNSHVWKTKMNLYSPKYLTRCSSVNQRETTNSLTFLELRLFDPIKWAKHEEIWDNIASIKELSFETESYLIPLNDKDILVSSYFKIYSSLNNIHTLSKLCKLYKRNTNFISLIINNSIKSPLAEMKKWKNVYKKVIIRWSPDKLIEVLNEIKFNDDLNRISLQSKSEAIVSNANKLFNQVMEILKKIQKAKNIIENIGNSDDV